MQRLWLVGVLAAVLLGAALRLSCLSAEFWLDEIWSWELVRGASSWWDVFVSTKHDNNHHLNTLWLFLCPDGDSWAVYRLQALAAGLLAIVLAANVARRWGKADAVFAALLVAVCYWLVLSSAEARGYALAVCFALLALDALWRYLEKGSGLTLAGFWLASVGGFLSHLTFVHAYLGFVAWTLRRQAQVGRPAREEIQNLLLVHGVPGIFFVGFYLASIRGMEVGGGPATPSWVVLERLVGMGLGGPGVGWQGLPWVVAAVVLFAVGLGLLAWQGETVWVFFLVAVVASPLLFMLRRPPFLFERYFLIPFVFFLLVVAHVLGTLWRAGTFRHCFLGWLVCILVLYVMQAIAIGNIVHVRAFARAGRGEFHQVLAWVFQNDPAPVVLVTGDHDFRVCKYVDFYARYVKDAREVVYLTRDELPAKGAEWLFIHRLDDRYPAAEVEHDSKGNAYRLVRAYPSRGPGCWGWFVYRR